MSESERKASPDPLGEMNELLTHGCRLIDQAATRVIPAGLDRENVRKLGEALVQVYDVQLEIYERRPDLMPDFLKGCDRFKPQKKDN